MGETKLAGLFYSIELQVIEPDALLNLVEGFDGDAQDAIDIINDWLDEIPPMIIDTRTAYEAGNAEKVKHCAHAVKSAARSVGAMQLGDMSEVLQKKGAEQSLTQEDSQLIADYVSNAERVESELLALKTHLSHNK